MDTQSDVLTYDDRPQPKLTTGLNVLTILTFIGCAIQLLFTLLGFFSAKSSYMEKDKAMEQMTSGEMPGWAKSMIPDPAHYDMMVTKSYENRLPILLLSLVACGLCFFGALQMRKLKKQGFPLYVIGELLPLLTTAVFIGTFMFSGMWAYVGIGIAVLFILLYTGQRKNLVY